MEYLPVFLDVRDRLPSCRWRRGRRTQVAFVASRRSETAVVAPELTLNSKRRERGEVEWLARPFHANDVEDVSFVVAASDDEDVNAEVSHLAQTKRSLLTSSTTSRCVQRSCHPSSTVRRLQLPSVPPLCACVPRGC